MQSPALAFIETALKSWRSRSETRDEGLSPSQIAILSPWRKDNTCLADIDTINRIPLTNDIEVWEKNEGVFFIMIRAFKGLESDVLLLIDVPVPGEHRAFTQAVFYVGASRAKSVLYVLAKDAAFDIAGKVA